jgi:hypothetical protein
MFICVMNRDEGSIALFSLARVWHALFHESDPWSLTIWLRGAVPDPNPRHFEEDGKLEPLASFLAVIKERLDQQGLDYAEARNRIE